MSLPQPPLPAPKGTSQELIDALLERYQDVILADIHDLKTITRQSDAWIYSAMKDESDPFPAPVIREFRCSRWRLREVLEWQSRRIARAAGDPKSNGERTVGVATRNSRRRSHSTIAAKGLL